MMILIFLSQDIHAEAVKKRRRTTKKPYSRSIVGATLEVIQKKRTEKPEVRDAAREAALRYQSLTTLSCLLIPTNWILNYATKKFDSTSIIWLAALS